MGLRTQWLGDVGPNGIPVCAVWPSLKEEKRGRLREVLR